MNDEELQQILGELREEPVPFASVRAGVLSAVARERKRRVVPLWAWSMASVATLILMTLAVRPAWKMEFLVLPAPPKLIVRTPSFDVAHPMAPVRRVQRIEPQKEAFTVKMLTADPDVVVYWIVGGEEE